jgi:outer membrane protein assembly factor BamB
MGDCMGDGGVSVDELLTGVNIALGRAGLLACPAFDDGSGVVRVSTVVAAVNNALEGCAAALPSWKQPGYAATHDAYNPTEEIISASNVATMTEIWRLENVGGDIAPIVSAARIFTVSRGKEEVLALAARDGREIWRHSVECEPFYPDICTFFGTPVITPDNKLTVVVGWSFGGGLRRFDPRDGDWVDDDSTWWNTRMGAPVVQGDEEFALRTSWGSAADPVAVSFRNFLVSSSFDNAPSVTAPSLLGGIAFVGVFRGSAAELRAFDSSRCPPAEVLCGHRWSVNLPGEATTPVTFADRVAVASIDGTLGGYDAATGDLLWSATFAGGLAHPPAVAHERLFQPDASGAIHAFAAGGCGSPHCAPIDSFELDAPIAGQPVVAGDVLYAGTENGTILAFDAFGCDEAPCQPLWAVDTQGGGITAGPIVTGGMLFATNSGGTLLAYGLPHAAGASPGWSRDPAIRGPTAKPALRGWELASCAGQTTPGRLVRCLRSHGKTSFDSQPPQGAWHRLTRSRSNSWHDISRCAY